MDKKRAQEIHSMIWGRLATYPSMTKRQVVMKLWEENSISNLEVSILSKHNNCAACVIAGRKEYSEEEERYSCPLDWFPGERHVCLGANPTCVKMGSPYFIWCSDGYSPLEQRQAAQEIRDMEWR